MERRKDAIERHEERIDRREEMIDLERDGRDIEPDAPGAKGDVLGISHVPTGGVGEVQPDVHGSSGRDDDEGRITAPEDEVDLGARDVTKNGRGQTGPETGGHGATPQRTGATGMDIG